MFNANNVTINLFFIRSINSNQSFDTILFMKIHKQNWFYFINYQFTRFNVFPIAQIFLNVDPILDIWVEKTWLSSQQYFKNSIIIHQAKATLKLEE